MPPCACWSFGVYLWSASPLVSQSQRGSHPLSCRAHCQPLCIQHTSGTVCLSPAGAGCQEKDRVLPGQTPGPAGMGWCSISSFREMGGSGSSLMARHCHVHVVMLTCTVARAFVTSTGSCCCRRRPGIQPLFQGTASSREPGSEPQPLAGGSELLPGDGPGLPRGPELQPADCCLRKRHDRAYF